MQFQHRHSLLIVAKGVGRLRARQRAVMTPLYSHLQNFQVLETDTGADTLALLEIADADLVIIADRLSDMTAAELCRSIRRERRARLMPVMVLGLSDQAADEAGALAAGADEFITLPISPPALQARAWAHVRRKWAADEREDVETILFSLAQTVEQRDPLTGGHCQRLADLSVRMGHRMGLSTEDVEALYRGGFLHDIGKIAVPDSVLFKPGPLSDDEWVLMRSHTVRGEEICKQMRTLAPVLPIIRSHHEKWDGTGYPDGLRREAIPLLARILQIADIYDALTTARPYKPAFGHQEAMDILRREARMGWRDPELVHLFTDLFPRTADTRVYRAVAS